MHTQTVCTRPLLGGGGGGGGGEGPGNKATVKDWTAVQDAFVDPIKTRSRQFSVKSIRWSERPLQAH